MRQGRPIHTFAALLLLGAWAGTDAGAAEPGRQVGGKPMFIQEKQIAATIDRLAAKHGEDQRARIEQGVRQVAGLWLEQDGTAEELADFCAAHFAAGAGRNEVFARFEENLEQLEGSFSALTLQLRRHMDEETGPLLPVDRLFAEFSPDAHVTDDLFDSKLAFIVLLNFPIHDLPELLDRGPAFTRQQWAEARLSGRFAHRVPAEVQQKITQAYAAADSYVYEYNVFMDRVVDPAGKPLFRKGLELISHWGLRDELKALYVDPAANLHRQEVIQTIMERIIAQQIPAAVINDPTKSWEPVANTVDGQPAPREPDTRYQRLLDVFAAHRLEDPYYPREPSHIQRRFDLQREIPEEQFVTLLEEVLAAPLGEQVARLIEQRLGRKLRPFDIWYDGFKARGSVPEEKLDQAVRARYPDVAAFQRAIPDILVRLGFDEQTARFIGERVEVDPARGAGHAWGPRMRTEKAHLRTKVPQGGMDYKGFNVAMHELGHNVEQVLSLYRIDHTLLAGVPNTAFTEGFAFVFQSRDLEVLGLARPDERARALNALDAFWATREIAGVALVDIRVWHWMYEHPEATAAEQRDATMAIAREVWRTHYAPIFGVADSPLLAIYSHMVNSGLYLPDYPLGRLIAFQVEDYFTTHPLGREMPRICALGNVTPSAWMEQAVGRPISAAPLLVAAEKALSVVRPPAKG